jgi:hypothetical protein
MTSTLHPQNPRLANSLEYSSRCAIGIPAKSPVLTGVLTEKYRVFYGRRSRVFCGRRSRVFCGRERERDGGRPGRTHSFLGCSSNNPASLVWESRETP